MNLTRHRRGGRAALGPTAGAARGGRLPPGGGPDVPDHDPQPADYRGLALIGTAVGEMVVPVLIGAWLDSRNGWSPWGMLVGAVLGFGGGFAHLVIASRRADRAKRDDGTAGGR